MWLTFASSLYLTDGTWLMAATPRSELEQLEVNLIGFSVRILFYGNCHYCCDIASPLRNLFLLVQIWEIRGVFALYSAIEITFFLWIVAYFWYFLLWKSPLKLKQRAVQGHR